MNTTTQPSTPSPKLQLTLNKKTLEIHMELNALLTSIGAPTGLVRISVNVTAHFANNVTGGFTRLRGV